MQQRGQQVGGFAEPFGSVPGGDASQIRLGGFAGLVVDGLGQVGEEVADDLHVFGPDPAGVLRQGGLLEHRGLGLS